MATSRRLEKLNKLIKEKISKIVLYELNDPRLGFITITKIKLSADLKFCTAFYSQIGTEAELSKTAHALEGATGFIQRAVARTLQTRQTPVLHFQFDPSIEGSIRVSKLIDKISQEQKEMGIGEEAGSSEGNQEDSEDEAIEDE
jgi:ribosome-binding factor A